MIEDENYYKLKMITNLIIKNLVKENLLDKKDLENLHINEEYTDGELIYVIKYHITLLNEIKEILCDELIFNFDKFDVFD